MFNFNFNFQIGIPPDLSLKFAISPSLVALELLHRRQLQGWRLAKWRVYPLLCSLLLILAPQVGGGGPGHTEIPRYREILQLFATFSQKFNVILHIFLSVSNYFHFPAIPAKFRKNFCVKWEICWEISKILQKSGIFDEILKIDAKISNILKMQLDNCVDLEKCEKMSLLSLSEASILPRKSLRKIPEYRDTGPPPPG